MIDGIRITSLTNIGSNLTYTTVFPVVDITGNAITNKANLQIIGNYILNQAGGANMVRAAQANLALSVANAAQPNITSVGTLTSLAVSGNANITGNLNIAVNRLKIPGGTNGYVLQTDGTGNLTWTAQTGNGGGGNGSPGGSNSQIQFNDAGSFGGDFGLTYNKTTDTLTAVTINAADVDLTGNVNANWVIGDYISGNGHNLFYIPGANINGAVPSATVASTVTTNAQPNITSVGTLANASVTGNVTAGNVYANSGTIGASLLTGTLTTAAQPNITSVGTLNSLSVTGNASANYFVGVATEVVVEAVNNNYSYHMAFVTGAGDTTLHMDNDDNLQYNPSSGLLTANRIDVDYLSVDTNIISNLIPFSNVTQNIGNNTNRWNDLYLANSTIYLGDATISATGNTIVVSNIEITDGNIGTIGNVAATNFDGNSSNVLYGNGIFDSVGSPFNQDLNTTDAVTFANITSTEAIRFSNNGNIVGAMGHAPNYVAIEGYQSNSVVVTANDIYSWTFGSNGLTTLPDGAIIDTTGNNFEVRAVENVNFEANSVVNIYTDGSNNAYQWQFGDDGNLTLPNGGNFNINGGRIQQTEDEDLLIVVQDVADDGYNLDLIVNDGTNDNTLLRIANDEVRIRSNIANSAYDWTFSDQGTFFVAGPVSGQYGSNLPIYILNNVGDGVGNVELQVKDYGSDSVLSNVKVGRSNVQIGTSTGTYLWTFDDTGLLTLPDGAIIDTTGNNFEVRAVENTNFEANAVVNIYTDTSNNGWQWQFDDSGKLNLAGGGSIIESLANSSLDPTNPNVSTMVLTPDSNYTSQILVLDPTAPGHLHLRTFASSNIDQPNANLFLGGEDTAFEVTSGSGNEARIHSGGNTWTFGNTGNLSAPGNITTSANVSGDVGFFNDLNLNNLGTNAFLYTDSNRNIYDTQFSYDSTTDTMSGGNISLTGNITANNLGNISVINLDSNTSNVLYGNGVFAAAPGGGGSNISNGNSNVNIATANGNVTIAAVGNSVVTITGTGANITGTANISGNANVGNLGVASVVATANISTTGYFISGNQATGGFQLGNSNSRLRAGDSNSYMTMGQNPAIYPDTTASASAGILIGGNGYLLGNNGSRCITLNYGGSSGVVGLQSNVQVGTGGTGTVLVPGTVTTGVNSILAGPTFTPLANTMAGFVSNVNSYTQLTIQNKNTGADATVDFVATADNGSDTVNYLDMGIINSGYDNNTPTNSLGNIVFAADSYMYAQGNTSNASQSGGNLAIGTTVPGKNVKIFAGGVDNTAIVANIANTGVSITGNLGVSGNITGNTNGFAIGYLNIPQVSASNTTLGLTDAGKHYYSTTAGNLTLTIPLNSTTAFPTGTAISIVVQAAGNVLVNAASGVSLYLAGNSTSANRVVGTFGMATLMKVATDTWFINGTGVS